MTYYDSDRSNEFGFGRPRPTSGLVGICIHTTESGKSATATARTADDVVSYQVRTQSGSYNVMVGVDGKVIRENTDDWQTWSTGNKGNDILLNLCVVGNASQSRAEWLAQDKMLRSVGRVLRYWSDKYRIPLRRVTAAGLPGILGHVDTRVWGGTDHADPGPNFPYDVVIGYAKGAPTEVVKPVVNAIDAEAKVAASWLGERVTKGEIKTPDGEGRFAEFANGYVCWNPKTGAVAVPMRIFETWAGHRWEAGFLGYPVRRHTLVKGGVVQAFQGGVIYRQGDQPGFPVRGVIGDRWAKEGFETGPLGWPTSDERDNGTGGRVQDFEHGRLEWDPSGAIKVVTA